MWSFPLERYSMGPKIGCGALAANPRIAPFGAPAHVNKGNMFRVLLRSQQAHLHMCVTRQLIHDHIVDKKHTVAITQPSLSLQAEAPSEGDVPS